MKVNKFISVLLDMEARVLSNDTVPDLDQLNNSIDQLNELIEGNITQSISPGIRTKLLSDSFYRFPVDYKLRHLFKLSLYKHPVYGDLWVAYLSRTNPRRGIEQSTISKAFLIVSIKNDLKVIGAMSVALSTSSMEPVGWDKDMYNPENIDINNLGQFISADRFHAPKDDGFSLQDYLENK